MTPGHSTPGRTSTPEPYPVQLRGPGWSGEPTLELLSTTESTVSVTFRPVSSFGRDADRPRVVSGDTNLKFETVTSSDNTLSDRASPTLSRPAGWLATLTTSVAWNGDEELRCYRTPTPLPGYSGGIRCIHHLLLISYGKVTASCICEIFPTSCVPLGITSCPGRACAGINMGCASTTCGGGVGSNWSSTGSGTPGSARSAGVRRGAGLLLGRSDERSVQKLL